MQHDSLMWADELGMDYAQNTTIFESDLSDCDFEQIIEASINIGTIDIESIDDAGLVPVDAQVAPDPQIDPTRNATRLAEQATAPNPPKRKYDRQKSRQSRARNRLIRMEGIKPPPPYQPKDATLMLDGDRLVYCKKRKYEASGRYVGANVKNGGTTRQFKKHPLKYMQQTSKFFEASTVPIKKRRQKRAGVQAHCAQASTTNEGVLSGPDECPVDVP